MLNTFLTLGLNKLKKQSVVNFSSKVQLLKARLEHIKQNIFVESIEVNGEIITLDDEGTLSFCLNDFF